MQLLEVLRRLSTDLIPHRWFSYNCLVGDPSQPMYARCHHTQRSRANKIVPVIILTKTITCSYSKQSF